MNTSPHIFSLLGINVIADRCTPQKQPKFYLKRAGYVSEEVRRDFNDFLIQNFGYEPCFFVTNGAIYIHLDNIQFLEILMTKVRNDTDCSADSADLIPWKDCRDNSPVYPLFQNLNAVS